MIKKIYNHPISIANKNQRRLITLLLTVSLILLFSYTIWFDFYRYTNSYHITGISDSGLTLLNDYEGYNIIDWQTDSKGNICSYPYDVGDGVVTFGLGQTYPNEKTGYAAINEQTGSDYQVGDCVTLEDSNHDQANDLEQRAITILQYDKLYKANINQNQFDAIMLMFYLNEDTIKDPEFWQMITDPTTTEADYTQYFLDIYAQFDQWDVYQAGWTKRIIDSGQLFYQADYTRNF